MLKVLNNLRLYFTPLANNSIDYVLWHFQAVLQDGLAYCFTTVSYARKLFIKWGGGFHFSVEKYFDESKNKSGNLKLLSSKAFQQNLMGQCYEIFTAVNYDCKKYVRRL